MYLCCVLYNVHFFTARVAWRLCFRLNLCTTGCVAIISCWITVTLPYNSWAVLCVRVCVCWLWRIIAYLKWLVYSSNVVVYIVSLVLLMKESLQLSVVYCCWRQQFFVACFYFFFTVCKAVTRNLLRGGVFSLPSHPFPSLPFLLPSVLSSSSPFRLAGLVKDIE